MGNGFLGTESIQTSKQREEIVPESPKDWTLNRYAFYKFSFINRTPCTVIINNGEPIFLDAEQGFESSKDDAPIKSFVIVESGVSYSWIGAY